MYSKSRKYWILHSIIRENKPTGSYVVIKTGKARKSQAYAPERWTLTFHFQKKVKSSPSNSFQHSTLHSLYILFCCFSWQMLAPLIKVASLVTCSKRHKPVPYVCMCILLQMLLPTQVWRVYLRITLRMPDLLGSTFKWSITYYRDITL